MAQFKNMYKVELNNGIAPVVSLKQIYYADVEANRIGAIVTMNGQPFPLSGTCTGSAILADGSTVPMAGVIDGNQAYIDLDSSCYSVEGQIKIFVKITTGGVTTTLLAAVGTVQLTETDTVIDPGTIIPSVSALITAIEDAVESIPADYTALLETIAPLYANLTFPVKAGQWCWYSGVLYEANQDISTSENWTAAHWETTTVGVAVSDLKSAVDGIIDKNYSANILNPDTIVNGKTFNNTGLVYNAELYFIAGPYPVSSGEKIYLWAQVGSYYSNVSGKLLFSDDGGNVVADGYVETTTDYNGNTGYSVPSGATQVKVSAYASYNKKAVTKEKITAYVPYTVTSILSETLVENSGIPYKSESLLYSEPQTLTSEQKQQGRENLGIVDAEPPDYTGKKVLFLGDSITRYNLEDNGWCKYFNQLMQPAKTVNVAVSGAVWSDYSNTVYDGNPDTNFQQNNTICNQVEKILRGKDSTNPNYSPVADYADFDIIIIAAGTNDSSSNFSEDNIKPTFVDNSLGYTVLVAVDDIDRKNACGAMRYAYEKLYSVYPNAHFYYCTPIQTYPTKKNWGETLNKGDVIKAMCRYLPVHAIDTEKCGIYGWHEQYNSMGVDLIDGLHPSESGAVKIGTYNANAVIKTYIPY